MRDIFTTSSEIFKLPVSNIAKLLYFYLESAIDTKDYGDGRVKFQLFPDTEAIAALFGVSIRTVEKAVRELIKIEYIEKTRYFDPETKHTHDVYVINDTPVFITAQRRPN